MTVLPNLLDAWQQAIDGHHPEQVADLFTEDAVFQGLHPYSIGRAGVQEYYAGQPAGMTVAYRILQTRELTDDVVLGWVEAEFTFVDPPPPPPPPPVVNNASVVALVGSAYPQIAYTAAKGGVLSMTREMAVLYGRKGIRFNAVCPGPVATTLVKAFIKEEANWETRRPYMPMGRIGTVEEVANLVTFLASDEASYITGAAYAADGGISAAYVIRDE
jgi:NAD(P)-dependent dehydrogenase (short-subunit alcohol dehydrogenase family)